MFCMFYVAYFTCVRWVSSGILINTGEKMYIVHYQMLGIATFVRLAPPLWPMAWDWCGWQMKESFRWWPPPAHHHLHHHFHFHKKSTFCIRTQCHHQKCVRRAIETKEEAAPALTLGVKKKHNHNPEHQADQAPDGNSWNGVEPI